MDSTTPDIFSMPDNTYLQVAAVTAIVGMTDLQLYPEIDAGKFPRPREVNNGVPLWLVGDIKGWLLAQQESV